MSWTTLHFLHDVSTVITIGAVVVGAALVLVGVFYGITLASAALVRRRARLAERVAAYGELDDVEREFIRKAAEMKS